MKAVVYRRYGSPEVLSIEEVPTPEVPEDGVLVRVRASSVNTADWFYLTGKPRLLRLAAGLFRPKVPVLGRDIAGLVESIGTKVTRFQPGDEVFGEIDLGGYAEYAVASQDELARRPSNLSFEETAALPLAGMTAIRGVNLPRPVEAGDRVLVNGASGAVGTFLVQVAKARGAEVTGVGSARNVEMIRGLGADRVVDYENEDVTKGEARFDRIVDFVGNHSLSAFRRVLAPGGLYVTSSHRMGRLFAVLVRAPFARGGLAMLPPTPSRDDLVALRDLAEAGKVEPVIERTYTLAEVPEALRAQGEGHARGKKVVTISTDS